MSDVCFVFGIEMVFQWWKWDGFLYWCYECVYFGLDYWGDWVGQFVGWYSICFGVEFYVVGLNVMLVLVSVDYVLIVNCCYFCGMCIYIDFGWDICWLDDLLFVMGIDMDFDVVWVEGVWGIWVDDCDEWVEYSVCYGYFVVVMMYFEVFVFDLEEWVCVQIVLFDDVMVDLWFDCFEVLNFVFRLIL